MRKLLLMGLCFCLCASAINAQTVMKVKEKKHYVKIKPKTPAYSKAASPGTTYMYVQDDWTWNPTTNTWDWNGNRWVERPKVNETWVPGHWTNTTDGWMWVEGHWK